jgi:hypothetical protein
VRAGPVHSGSCSSEALRRPSGSRGLARAAAAVQGSGKKLIAVQLVGDAGAGTACPGSLVWGLGLGRGGAGTQSI